MGNVVIALFVAAGLSAFIYSQLGKRIGYGNTQQVWTLIGIAFVITFVVVFFLAGSIIPSQE